MSAIALESATLAIGGRPILSDISLAIGEGEFIGLLGANGAGKTTLIRAILGLLRPAGGTISVLGAPARRGNPAIGYLPQARGALPALGPTARDFIASSIHGERFGLPLLGPAARRELDEALAIVDGAALADRPLGALSGGERQRLLFAQALIGKPRILLLDEPLMSLDPRHQQSVVDLARRLCREMKITVLFSAHDLNQLLGSIDRVLYLGNGQAALGTVEDVVTAPVLSRLYGAPIEVLRMEGRIFVLSGRSEVEHDAHLHDHAHGHHQHHDHHHHGHS